jgi:hypothetical protein
VTSASIRINVLEPISNNSILTPPQEICEGMTFINIEGTVAPALAGGDNGYSFRWERSTDGSTWLTATGISNAVSYNPDENAPPFPGQEYYRRVVFSGSGNVCVDTSGSVLIREYPVITNNSIVSGDQTICSGAVPLQLTGSAPRTQKGTYILPGRIVQRAIHGLISRVMFRLPARIFFPLHLLIQPVTAGLLTHQHAVIRAGR